MYLDFDVVGTGFEHVLYLGRAPRTKGTLPDFREKCRVTRHSRGFRGLTGSQRTPGKWGVTIVLIEHQILYTCRKGYTTTNVMAAYDFNLCFTFVLAR